MSRSDEPTVRIEGASLPIEPSEYGFAEPFSGTARAFQNRTADWIHGVGGDEPIAVLRAPTGAGKTATFHELIDASGLTLLVYPTNALLRQQKERFEREWDVEALTGDSLESHGRARTREILRKVNQFTTDVVITNPDILQWIVQNGYYGNDAMEVFDRFDAIVYDEFHVYGDLATSGLLLQTRVLVDRNPAVRILLASATPNDAFPTFIRSNLDLPVRDIAAQATTPTSCSDDLDLDLDRAEPFRHTVRLYRQGARRILDDRQAVADRLRDAIDGVERGDVRAAVVFNSVRDSNAFHRWLAAEHPELFDRTEKDNGFDTDDPDADLDAATFSILNTTSKGEVGLDYDIRTLIMETPRGPTAAPDFLQRFGRAGRQAPAAVDVYGLGTTPWNGTLSFSAFAESVYETLPDAQTDQDALADLVGLRAVYALYDRERSGEWFNPEIHEDFATVDRYDRWRGFLEAVDRALDDVGRLGGTFQPGDREVKLLRFVRESFAAFRGLRGRSLSGAVQYPRGDRMAVTTYSLLASLRYYDIDRIETAGAESDESDEPVIVLGRVRDQPRTLSARLSGYEDQSRDIGSQQDTETVLSRWIHSEIDRADFGDAVSSDLLHLYFRRVRLTDVVVPTRVQCGSYRIDVELGEIPAVETIKRIP